MLKADVIAHYIDRGVIGVAGVGNYPKEFGRELRERIPELKRVSVAYDADVVRNPQVQLHLAKLQENLRGAGLEVSVLKWEESQGKGLDDYLKNRLTKHFRHVRGAAHGAWQGRVLDEVGWDGRRLAEGRSAGAGGSADEVEHANVKERVGHVRETAAADYETRTREIERGLALGDELIDRWRVEECRERPEARREGARLWRYEVTDESTGLRREMSVHDVETRARGEPARGGRADESRRRKLHGAGARRVAADGFRQRDRSSPRHARGDRQSARGSAPP